MAKKRNAARANCTRNPVAAARTQAGAAVGSISRKYRSVTTAMTTATMP